MRVWNGFEPALWHVACRAAPVRLAKGVSAPRPIGGRVKTPRKKSW
jgi:hypothetical protein